MSGTQEQEPLTITVEAKDVSPGDWVVPKGIVRRADNSGLIVLVFDDDVMMLDSTEKVEIRLEDRGEDGPEDQGDDGEEN